MIKKIVQLVNEKIYTTERIVDRVFSSFRDIMAGADDEIRIEIRDLGVFEVKKTKPKLRERYLICI